MTSMGTVPLSSLKIDPTNVRHVGREPDAELIASIAARGILTPLRVRPPKGPNGGEGYLVIAGARRLAALQALVEQGKLGPDDPVPVVEADSSDAEAREDSLAENVHRRSLHPVDEYRAFAALHTDRERPLDVDAIAERFGLARRHVEQRLALGDLAEPVLEAWRAGRITAEIAQLFTLAGKKVQAKVVERFLKDGGQISKWDVSHALKVGGDNVGHLLEVVGEAAYAERGGKVTRDLFGTNHVVSDAKLLQAMAAERIEEECQRLVAAGWSWAVPRSGVRDYYAYGEIQAKAKPTPEEKAEIDRLRAALEQSQDRYDGDAEEEIGAELDRIEAEVARRSYTNEQMARAGCFVRIERGRLIVDYGKVKPAEKKAAAAAERRAAAKAAPGERAAPKPDIVSNALCQRLSEQLTAAAGAAIARQPLVAMAALLAGFATGDKTVSVTENGLARKKSHAGRTASFAGALELALAKSPAELQAGLAQVCAAALDFQRFRGDDPPLRDKGVAALCAALDPKLFNAAMAEAFDAKDYFGAVSKATIAAAVKEAMGGDHARKAAAMKTAEAAKFAIANVAPTGWLPPQLRTAHYDGPGAGKPKAAPAKSDKPKAKAKKPAGKAKR